MQPANDTAHDPHRAARLAAEEQERAYQARHRWQGDLWVARRDVRDTAKLVRATLKAETGVGAIPAGTRFSVRVDRYSMGESIRVRVTVPEAFLIPNRVRVEQDMDPALRHLPSANLASLRSPEASALLGAVEVLCQRYNRSWSDKHQEFYLDLDFDSDQEQRQRAALRASIEAARLIDAAAAD